MPSLSNLQLILNIKSILNIKLKPNITSFSILDLVRSPIYFIAKELRLFMRKPTSSIIVLVLLKRYYYIIVVV